MRIIIGIGPTFFLPAGEGSKTRAEDPKPKNQGSHAQMNKPRMQNPTISAISFVCHSCRKSWAEKAKKPKLTGGVMPP